MLPGHMDRVPYEVDDDLEPDLDYGTSDEYWSGWDEFSTDEETAFTTQERRDDLARARQQAGTPRNLSATSLTFLSCARSSFPLHAQR